MGNISSLCTRGGFRGERGIGAAIRIVSALPAAHALPDGQSGGREKRPRFSPSVFRIRLWRRGRFPLRMGAETRDRRRACRHESRKLKQARRLRAGTVDLLRGRIRACYSPNCKSIISRKRAFVKKNRKNEIRPLPGLRPVFPGSLRKNEKKLSKNDKNILTNELIRDTMGIAEEKSDDPKKEYLL